MTLACDTKPALPASQILAGGLDGDARQVLAAKSLVQLSSQFAADQDLQRLVEILALTIAGQFAVTSVFATFLNPDSRSSTPIHFAGGNFREAFTPSYASALMRCTHLSFVGDSPSLLEAIPHDCLEAFPQPSLLSLDVRILVPFLHQGRTIGLIGLGPRIGRNEYSESDLALIDLLVKAVTPLVANAFMVAELAQQTAWYRTILNGVRHGVIVVGLDQTIMNVNRSALRLLRDAGATAVDTVEDLIGLPFTELFSEDLFPGWSRRLLSTEGATIARRSLTLSARIADKELLFALTSSILPASGSQEACILLTCQDVTAQKQSEQKLFELEKYAERGMMASSIAHELNNFLGLILGGSELAAMMLEKQQYDRVASSLTKLKANALKMERFTASLVDYSRMNTSKQSGDLNAIVADVISFVSMQKRFSRVVVEPNLSPAVGQFDMDPDQIAQLIINLLNNAADAIQETGGQVGRISVMTERKSDVVRLIVRDNGCGMTEDVRNRLFKSHLTTKPKGHGYGLMVCGKIISNHNGEVDIISAQGQGSTMTISFRTNQEVSAQQA